MADLTRPFQRRRPDRGQIILIAAFALAVTFVALAIIVNSAIFTENLASRGETAGSDEALFLRYELERVIGDVVRHANVHDTTDLDTAVSGGVENATHAIQRQQAASGAYVNVTDGGSTTDGSRIAQNESTSRQFLSAGGSSDWTVVEDVTGDGPYGGTRAFQLSVAKSSLATSGSAAFEVEVDDGTDRWEMELWRDGSGSDDVVVRVEADVDGDGSLETHECTNTVAGSTIDVHVTRGTVDGTPCSALRRVPDVSSGTSADYGFGAGVGTPYDVSFVNGDEIAGNYSLVTTNASIASSSALNTGGSRTSPYATDAVYSLTVDYEYERPRMAYRTEVRVAPGESP